MADPTAASLFGRFSRREALAAGSVVAMLVGSHLVAPVLVPGYAVYTQYATYLVAFSVWMAWFVDWLATWLGQDPHPSEREGEEAD